MTLNLLATTSTETGCITMFVPNSSGEDDWQYFKISKHLDVEVAPQENLDNVFELIILVSDNRFSVQILQELRVC